MDTGNSYKKQKPRPSLSKIILDHVSKTVDARNKSLEGHHQRILSRIVNPILSRLGDYDDRLQAHELNAASCYVGLQHHTPYEFDVVVTLSFVTLNKSLGSDKSTTSSMFLDSSNCNNPYVNKLPGYGYIIIDQDRTLVHNLTSDRYDSVHSEKMLENVSYLCPRKVMSVFHQCIQQAVQDLENKQWWEKEPTVFQVDVSRQGQGVKLTAYLTGEVFTIHLLPGIPFSDHWPKTLKQWGPPSVVRPNPWLTSLIMREVTEDFIVFPGQTAEEEDSRLWAMCFYYSEKKLCKLVEQNVDTIHRESRLALEAICVENEEAFYPITPRLLRIIFLHQCMQFPHEKDWYPNKLGRAFVDLFLAVISATKSGECPHYFIPQLNMFGHLDKVDLKQVSRHLRAILNDVMENPAKTKFLHQNCNMYSFSA